MRDKLKNHGIFLAGFLLVTAFLIWRLPYGLAQEDESFYVTIALRLARGGSLITQEWHIAQLSQFLLYPVVKVYMHLAHQSTEWMLLNFRVIWLLVHLCVTVIAYLLLQKYDRGAAAAAALLYALYMPYGLMALNYNSMGMGAAWLLAILFLPGAPRHWAFDLARGVLTAVMVLCCPYTMVIYLVYLTGAAVVNLRHCAPEWLKPLRVLRLHAGILILLVPFLITVLPDCIRMGSLADVLTCIKAIRDVPDHTGDYILTNAMSSLHFYWEEHAIEIAAGVLLFAAGLWKKPLRPVCTAGMLLVCCVTAVRETTVDLNQHGMNMAATALITAGFAAWLFTPAEHRVKGFVLPAFGFPVLYGGLLLISSNVGLSSSANVLQIAACLSAFPLFAYFKQAELPRIPRRAAALVPAAAGLAVALCMVHTAYSHFFWENNRQSLAETIEAGPCRGMHTSNDHKLEYNALYYEIQSMGDLRGKKVLFFRVMPQATLMANCETGSPSPYLITDSIDDDYMRLYYSLNPQNRPDYIFIDYSTDTTSGWTVQDYLDYAEQNGYTVMDSTMDYLWMVSDELVQ